MPNLARGNVVLANLRTSNPGHHGPASPSFAEERSRPASATITWQDLDSEPSSAVST